MEDGEGGRTLEEEEIRWGMGGTKMILDGGIERA